MPAHDSVRHSSMHDSHAPVPDSARRLALWARASGIARAALGPKLARLDVRYGAGANETLDVFPSATAGLAGAPGAPVLVFIHGGASLEVDKSDQSFLVPAFLRSGACVVVPNYASKPGSRKPPSSVPENVMQMVRALAWVWQHADKFGGDRNRITVVGHSAGGHLATMLLSCRWKQFAAHLPSVVVRNALSISGLYDLVPLRRTTFLPSSPQLTTAQIRKASPARLPAPVQRPLWAVVGEDEGQEYLQQTALIRDAWGVEAVPFALALPDLNHYSILETLAEPGHALHGMALSLLHD